jgi:hypothetical protein
MCCEEASVDHDSALYLAARSLRGSFSCMALRSYVHFAPGHSPRARLDYFVQVSTRSHPHVSSSPNARANRSRAPSHSWLATRDSAAPRAARLMTLEPIAFPCVADIWTSHS